MARDLCSWMGMVLRMFLLSVLTGCSGPGAKVTPTVCLDPAANGAASGGAIPQRSDSSRRETGRLAFVSHGVGLPPTIGGEQERRLAMSQAAIIDALGEAVAESRRLAGQPAGDFSCELGPRVSIRRRGADTKETELCVSTTRGTKTLRTRHGVLQDKPCDLATLERIMEATGGQYALLSIEQSAGGTECIASVARYEPDMTVIAKRSEAEGAR